MKMGLVGYAGSGKSTVFEWLTGEKPDPSKVQQGQTAMADVPDERLAKIAAIIKPKKTTYTKVAVLDTPGLMVDERKDNPRRLGIIREANGMVVVLDGFTRTDFADQLDRSSAKSCCSRTWKSSPTASTSSTASLKKGPPGRRKSRRTRRNSRCTRGSPRRSKPARPRRSSASRRKKRRPSAASSCSRSSPRSCSSIAATPASTTRLPADLLALAPTAIQAPVKLEMELAAMGDEDRQMFMGDLGVTEFQRDSDDPRDVLRRRPECVLHGWRGRVPHVVDPGGLSRRSKPPAASTRT